MNNSLKKMKKKKKKELIKYELGGTLLQNLLD